MTAVVLLVLLGVTGFNAWLLLLTRRDLREVRRAQRQLAAAPPKPELPRAKAATAPPRQSALPPRPALSAGAEVADRFLRRVLNGELDAALEDAGESIDRDRLDAFHEQHRAWAGRTGPAEVDDGDARATVRYADANRSEGSCFSVTSALVGKRWVVIELSAGSR